MGTLKLGTIAEILDATFLTDQDDLDMEIPCAFSSALISDILESTKEPTLLLTDLTNPQIIRLADMIDLLGIVMVRGKLPSEDVIRMAKVRNLPLLSTRYTLYKSSGMLYSNGLRSCKI